MDIEEILREELNAQQLEAVLSTDGPVLVVAGAGSGKTRVIEFRTWYLVEKGVPPERILLLTFTRKAAFEMLSRAGARNPLCARVEGGTFHSFAYKQLMNYGRLIGLPQNFTVLDREDSEHAFSVVMETLGLKEREEERFPRPATVADIYSKAVNKGIRIKEVLEQDFPHFAHLAEQLSAVARAYIEYKRRNNYLDYDDLLVYFMQLLSEVAEVRKKISGKFLYIMVDEYQDTNPIQAEIVRHLASEHGNIMVVGDDAQSIYRFRGATHENIMRFPEMFPGTKIVKLEYNYRSTQEILDLSNEIMKILGKKYEKRLVSAHGKHGERPQLWLFRNFYEENSCIADEILRLYNEGVELREIAVLYRAGYLSIPLQMELDRRRIPYAIYGGLKYYQLAHVKDILSYLRVMENVRDEISWHRLLKLERGIGEKTAAKVTLKIQQIQSIEEAVDVLSEGGFSKLADASLKELAQLFSEAASIQRRTPAALLELFHTRRYSELIKLHYDNWPVRLRDIEMLIRIAAPYRSVSSFLSDLVIEEEPRFSAEEGSRLEDEDKVILSTIHSAKGLEWRIVFLKDVEEGVLPSEHAFGDPEALEEEKRLFYVAATRAKERLYLTCSGDLTKDILAVKSRFLTDEILNQLDIKAVVYPWTERIPEFIPVSTLQEAQQHLSRSFFDRIL